MRWKSRTCCLCVMDGCCMIAYYALRLIYWGHLILEWQSGTPTSSSLPISDVPYAYVTSFVQLTRIRCFAPTYFWLIVVLGGRSFVRPQLHFDVFDKRIYFRYMHFRGVSYAELDCLTEKHTFLSDSTTLNHRRCAREGDFWTATTLRAPRSHF